MKTIKYYGCVKCQKQHWQDIEPELYQEHLYWQSKHGIQDKLFFDDDKAQAYIEEIKAIKGVR